jgi:hypothetical protein
MKILKILLSWSALYCLPSFANLADWITGAHKAGHSYSVNWRSDTTLSKEQHKEKIQSFANDGVQHFNEVLGKNWDDLSPHYNSHFANTNGALLSPIKNNTYPTFPLTTAEKKLHTAFKVVDSTIDEFIKKNILENVASVNAPEMKKNEHMYNVTLSNAIPFYNCTKKNSVMKWKLTHTETYDSETEIGKINHNGYAMKDRYADHKVKCDEMGETNKVTITANNEGQVSSIYPTT